jgi:L-lactate dehydrogenase complex protein LldG
MVEGAEQTQMRARDRVFERVRAAVAALPNRQSLPDYEQDVAVARGSLGLSRDGDLVSIFKAHLERVGGRAFTDPAALAAWLLSEGATHGTCDPKLMPLLAPAFDGALTLETTLDRERIDEYRFGITRASGAIAETGTLILTDADTSRRLTALAPWIHVAVLRRRDILPTVADGIARLGDDPNVIWCTGPSKTADVEGILIEGVHGPGEQVALIVDT